MIHKPCPTILPAAVLAFGILSMAVNPLSVSAQSALGISAIPPRVEITLEPGKVTTKEIKVRNESKTDKVMETNVKDFIVTDDSGTPIQIENVDTENRWAASNWITVSPDKFQIKSGETKTLLLTISAPDDALPGGHYAMVLHSPNNDALINSTGSYIQTNVGSLVYITIPGDIRESAKIKDFIVPKFSEYGPIDFKAIITNLSDIHIAPKGNIQVTNMFGGQTANLDLPATNIFPYTSRDLQSTLNKKWLIGRYKATFAAAYGSQGQALTTAAIFWVIPWRLITLVLATLAIIIALILIGNKSQVGLDNGKVDELEKELEKLKKKYQDRK